MIGQRLGLLDVSVLGGLVTTTKQDDQHFAARHVINPLAGSIVDTQFRYAAAYWFHVTGVPHGQTVQPCGDTHYRTSIPQASQPAIKKATSDQLNHVTTIVSSLANDNYSYHLFSSHLRQPYS